MNRIDLLASLTKGKECVCDVGCDHAYVLVKAIKEYNVVRGIACDIAEGPLSCAKETIHSYHLEDWIDIVLSDGFKRVDTPFDCAVIAGMGGILIRNILDAGKDKILGKRLILEANTDSYLVREWLSLNHIKITDEYAIYDMDKYYEVIVAEGMGEELTLEEISYGPILLKKKPQAFIAYYKKRHEMLSEVIKNVKNEGIRKEKEKELKEIENAVLR